MKHRMALSALVALATAAVSGSAWGQCSQLSVISPSPGTFEAGTDDIGNHCDDCATFVSLPFSVAMYGQSYSTAYVGSNGHLTFGSYTFSVFGNTCTLPYATFPDGPTVFVHWDDLRTDMTAPGIFTSTSGADGSRRFNIEWRAVYYAQNTVPLNFSITFYENQSFFDVFYQDVPNSGVSATCAVQADGVAGSSTTTFSCNASGTPTGTKIRYLCPDNLPPSCSQLTALPNSGPVGTQVVVTSRPMEGIPAQPITGVSLNASAVDAGTVPMLDDGVSPDVAQGDGTYTAAVTVGANSPFGNRTLICTVTDSQNRTGECTTSFNVIPPPPVNDECSGALAVTDGQTPWNNASATTSFPAYTCGFNGGNDLWYKYTAANYGTLTVDTCGTTNGTTNDTVLAFYSDCDGTLIACNDDTAGCLTFNSRLTTTLCGDQTVYIRVGGYNLNIFSDGFLNVAFTPLGGGGTSPSVGTPGVTPGCIDGSIGGTVTITVAAAPNQCTASPLESVTLHTAAIGGGDVPMLDDGNFPDTAAGDGIFTANADIAAGTVSGVYGLGIDVRDQASQTASATANVTVANGGADEGDMPATASVLSGDGRPISGISGFLGSACTPGNDVDMFKFQLCDPANFSATLCNGGAAFDSQLFLFDANGMGVVHMDDSCGTLSALSSTFTASLPAGVYYLAVSGYNIDPIDEGGNLIWANTPFNVERTPDGPAATSPVAAWSGTGGGGAYTIAMTGACTISGAPPCDPDYNQDGNADQDDVAYIVNVIAGGPNPSGRDPDFNQDGNVDQDDYRALVDVIAGAPCP